MATAFEEKTRAEQFGDHTVTSGITHESTCDRCGGLMVKDLSMDLLNNLGESKFLRNAVCNVARLSIL